MEAVAVESTAWQQALLKEERGMLVPSNSPDESALLRARTLLAYLSGENKLAFSLFSQGGAIDVVLVHHKDQGYNLFSEIQSAQDVLGENPDVMAIVFYRPFEPIVKQPALAVLRAELNANSIFNKIWLKSSLSWLKKHPHERVQLDFTFNK